MEKVYADHILKRVRKVSDDGSTCIELMKRLILSPLKTKIKKRPHKKLKNIKKSKEEDLGPPPEMSAELRENIEKKGGVNIALVIMKKIYKSDLEKSLNRLSMPLRQVIESNVFLKEEEKLKLKNGGVESNVFLKEEEKSKLKNGGVDVKLMEPCYHVSDQSLRLWDMNSDSYVLTSKWNSVWERQENQNLDVFKVNNVIQVWSFRVDDKLWFAINKVVKADVSALSSRGEASSSTNSSRG
ncbi:hypothetical protein M5689_004804 [Euphorbia peplus]|nr:hypothetical protein M5689_004804 [Euphorbia peplus]